METQFTNELESPFLLLNQHFNEFIIVIGNCISIQISSFCKVVIKPNTSKQAREEFVQARVGLIDWGTMRGYGTRTLRRLAYLELTELFETHTFHKEVTTTSGTHLEYADSPILHPLTTIDRGLRSVDYTTNTFMQQIRRRLSILEGPLTTARGDGKSYIYSHFNPKYAQMAITIQRTYYNFCFAYKTKGTMEKPAQRLGITDEKFDLKDIIYLR